MFFVRARRTPAGNSRRPRAPFSDRGRQQQTPAPTPTPTPGARTRVVVIQPVSGKALVKLPGTTKFAAVDVTRASRSARRSTRARARSGCSRSRRPASPESALFYDGIFKVNQVGGITELQLTEELASCPTSKARPPPPRRSRRRASSGATARQLPHPRPVQRGHRPRHEVARAGLLHHDAHARRQGRGVGQRLRQAQDDPAPRAAPLHRPQEALKTSPIGRCRRRCRPVSVAEACARRAFLVVAGIVATLGAALLRAPPPPRSSPSTRPRTTSRRLPGEPAAVHDPRGRDHGGESASRHARHDQRAGRANYTLNTQSNGELTITSDLMITARAPRTTTDPGRRQERARLPRLQRQRTSPDLRTPADRRFRGLAPTVADGSARRPGRQPARRC